MAPLCATPSVPPVPCTQASRAPATWRSPHSPRSCFTASITRKMPRMPGMVRRQAAAVGVHRQLAAEPDAAARSRTPPPSPGLQKPRFSSVASTVMVNES